MKDESRWLQNLDVLFLQEDIVCLHICIYQSPKLENCLSSKINQKENTLHFSFDLFSFK